MLEQCKRDIKGKVIYIYIYSAILHHFAFFSIVFHYTSTYKNPLSIRHIRDIRFANSWISEVVQSFHCIMSIDHIPRMKNWSDRVRYKPCFSCCWAYLTYGNFVCCWKMFKLLNSVERLFQSFLCWCWLETISSYHSWLVQLISLCCLTKIMIPLTAIKHGYSNRILFKYCLGLRSAVANICTCVQTILFRGANICKCSQMLINVCKCSPLLNAAKDYEGERRKWYSEKS